VQTNAFIEFALAAGVLKFGSFELKSGRISPYFFNAGLFADGASLSRLGSFYAEALVASETPFDVLFGPPYKGIPLAAAMAIGLANDFGRPAPYAYARKEVKTHGEGGQLVGAPLTGRVVIVDDVITAGTAIRESIEIIQRHGAEVAAVIVAIDRQERGQNSDQSAIQEVEETFDIPVLSLVTFEQIIEYVSTSDAQDNLASMMAYRETYGAKS
jgi:orotate phosphoribosyltransferase